MEISKQLIKEAYASATNWVKEIYPDLDEPELEFSGPEEVLEKVRKNSIQDIKEGIKEFEKFVNSNKQIEKFVREAECYPQPEIDELREKIDEQLKQLIEKPPMAMHFSGKIYFFKQVWESAIGQEEFPVDVLSERIKRVFVHELMHTLFKSYPTNLGDEYYRTKAKNLLLKLSEKEKPTPVRVGDSYLSEFFAKVGISEGLSYYLYTSIEHFKKSNSYPSNFLKRISNSEVSLPFLIDGTYEPKTKDEEFIQELLSKPQKTYPKIYKNFEKYIAYLVGRNGKEILKSFPELPPKGLDQITSGRYERKLLESSD